MRKFLMLICALAVLMTTGCNSNSSSDKEKEATDSLCYLIGTKNGVLIKQQMYQAGDSSLINNADLIKGAELSMNLDTADVSFRKGLENGINLFLYIPTAKAEINIDLNKDIILESYEKAINGNDNDIDPAKCQERISEIIEKTVAGKLTGAEEELSRCIGMNFGIGAKQEIKFSPDSAKFNGSELIKATKLILNNESFSYIVGVGTGIDLDERISAIEAQLNVKLDRTLVLDSYKNAVNADNANAKPLSEYEESIGNILNQLNNRKEK